MAVPTVTSITPNTGMTRGRRLVRIVGTGFQLPPPPAPSGKTSGTLKPSVQVLFGEEPAPEVHVLSSTLLHVVSPAHAPAAVSLTVRNVDQNGEVVDGETVTVPSPAFTFERPNLNRVGHGESQLARVVRTFIREIKRQLIENVTLTVHVDYDDTPDGANVAHLATLPGLVLSGPQVRANRFYATNQAREVSQGGATYQQRPGVTVDLVFTVVGAHDTMQTSLNFLQETIGFFNVNKVIRVLRDPTVAGDFVELELEVEEQFSSAGGSNNSNVRSFSGTVAIRGLDLDDEDMAIREVFDIVDVETTGAVFDGAPPWTVILTGMPGTYPAPPHPPNPVAEVGNSGPIEQIPPEE